MSLWRRKGSLAFLLLWTLSLIWQSSPLNLVFSQNPASQKIESDDPRVLQSGIWTAQFTSSASNGSYLFSSGAEADVLGLSFVGEAIEIIYVAGPQLGTLAIEVDGVVLRTVITTADKIAYGQTAKVDYLSDEPHSLKVYAQAEGTIAVDAFVITPLTGASGMVQEDAPASTVNAENPQDPAMMTCAPQNTTHRVSVGLWGAGLNGASWWPDINSDGRYVVYSTHAQVGSWSNGLRQVYRYDRLTCTTLLISVALDGQVADFEAIEPAISSGGNYVVFISNAENLPGGHLSRNNVWWRDTLNFSTVLLTPSVGTPGGNAFSPVISRNNAFVAFAADMSDLVAGDTNNVHDIFIRNISASTTTRLSVSSGGTQGNGDSDFPDISADGRYVVFESDANNLVAGDTNTASDIFIRDRQLNTTTRISVATNGTQATGSSGRPKISADGRYVVFESDANNLVAGDTNTVRDIFIRDRQLNTTTRISVASNGTQGNGLSVLPDLSEDGRYIPFASEANNLVAGDTNSQRDIFVYDQQTGTTTRVSMTAQNTQATGGASSDPQISGNGQLIAFYSATTNLIPNDVNGFQDIFVTTRAQTGENLALINPAYNVIDLLYTLQDTPPITEYAAFSAKAPVTGGQWVMGDWDGDGQDNPGVYKDGIFYYTYKFADNEAANWTSLWIGINGPPVAGRFSGLNQNDCIGAVQQAVLGGSTVFVLYYTCQVNGTAAPPISNQWLSAVLPDSGGFSGTHQFGAGDFNGDGLDSIAVRRGTSIAFGNVAPTVGPATFDLAQYIGAPSTNDAGIFVVGDWDADRIDSFGLFYQNGEFFYRNDLQFNSGVYVNQSVGTPFGNTGVQATTWR